MQCMSRSRDWRSCGVLVFLTILQCVQVAAAQGGEAKRPNIVYIVADDLGWKDVGFHGSDIKTPNIDKLANEGVRLNQFYVQPMCTPTRAALMTGRYPLRYGLQTAVIPSGYTYGLATDEKLLPQFLKEAGYRTAIIGKWHLGHADPKFWPRQRGFDYQYGAMLGEIDYFTRQAHGVTDWYRDNKRVNEKGYVTELLGEDAVKVVNAQDPNVPFFLYLAFTAPHAPYQAPREYVDRYAAISDPTRRSYAGMITAMDDQIGRVLSTLEKRRMLDNTLIIFMSDNGGNLSPMFSGEGDVTKLKLPSDNGPYRDGKGTLYEGGTRVVAFANWAGRIRPGEVDQPIHVVDMLPTLTRLAGVTPVGGKPLDGVDVWKTISEGETSPRNEVVYNVEPFRGAVRQGAWKLIWKTPLPQVEELYNITEDPSEKHDVSAAQPEKVAELKRRIEELARESQKPLFIEPSLHSLKAQLAVPPALPSDESVPGVEP